MLASLTLTFILHLTYQWPEFLSYATCNLNVTNSRHAKNRMVDNPITLTLSDLLDPHQFSPITLPVTLVCAGNRRKEQNVVRQSLGFSWGASGLSTALFTGVYLADVLEKVCPRNEGLIGVEGFKRAEHVIFEGAEDLPEGKYGTSQRLRWARMREKGMMLCWAMNGEVSPTTAL